MDQNPNLKKEIIISMAEGVMAGRPLVVSIDQADNLGMRPGIHEDGAWGVNANVAFELETEVHATADVISAEQDAMDEADAQRAAERRKAAWNVLDREHIPSGRGLKRVRPEGETLIGRASVSREREF